MSAEERDVPLLDEATRAAITALAHRVRARDAKAGTDRVDAELFATEFLIALRGQGWRPTAARAPEPWRVTGAAPDPEVYARGAEAARRVLAGGEAP